MDHRDPDNSARHYTRYRFHRIGNSSGQVCGHVFTRNGGWWQNQCRQPSEDHWSEHSPRWRHPHPAEAGQTSRKMAMLLGCWPRFKDGYFLGRWWWARLRFAFLSRSIDDSSKRRSNVSWKSWKKGRRGDTAAPVVFSCCVRRIVKVSPPRWMKTGEIKGRTDGAVHCEEVLAARED